jgi:hypothetical protein
MGGRAKRRADEERGARWRYGRLWRVGSLLTKRNWDEDGGDVRYLSQHGNVYE